MTISMEEKSKSIMEECLYLTEFEYKLFNSTMNANFIIIKEAEEDQNNGQQNAQKIQAIKAALSTAAEKAWTTIKNFFTNLWEKISGLFEKIIAGAKSLKEKFITKIGVSQKADKITDPNNRLVLDNFEMPTGYAVEIDQSAIEQIENEALSNIDSAQSEEEVDTLFGTIKEKLNQLLANIRTATGVNDEAEEGTQESAVLEANKMFKDNIIKFTPSKQDLEDCEKNLSDESNIMKTIKNTADNLKNRFGSNDKFTQKAKEINNTISESDDPDTTKLKQKKASVLLKLSTTFSSAIGAMASAVVKAATAAFGAFRKLYMAAVAHLSKGKKANPENANESANIVLSICEACDNYIMDLIEFI